MAKITITAEMPDETVGLFLQHIRDFDVVQKDCHFAIAAVTGLKLQELERMLKAVTPPFKHTRTERKH